MRHARTSWWFAPGRAGKDRRGRTRQVIDLVGFHIQRNRHVVPQHFEVGIVEKMFDILLRTAEKIVDAENVTSLRE